MAWTEPVTDRTQADYDNRTDKAFFGVADYSRIKGNLEHVAALAGVSSLLVGMDAVTYMDYPFARRLNALEQNIDILADAIYRPPSFAATKTWLPGGLVPSWTDANRWEACIALLKGYTDQIIAAKLPTPMGAWRGF